MKEKKFVTITTDDLDKIATNAFDKGQKILAELSMELIIDEEYSIEDFLEFLKDFLKSESLCTGHTKPSELFNLLIENTLKTKH